MFDFLHKPWRSLMEGISRTSILYKWFGKNCGPPNCALICLALALAPAAAHVIGALCAIFPGFVFWVGNRSPVNGINYVFE